MLVVSYPDPKIFEPRVHVLRLYCIFDFEPAVSQEVIRLLLSQVIVWRLWRVRVKVFLVRAHLGMYTTVQCRLGTCGQGMLAIYSYCMWTESLFREMIRPTSIMSGAETGMPLFCRLRTENAPLSTVWAHSRDVFWELAPSPSKVGRDQVRQCQLRKWTILLTNVVLDGEHEFSSRPGDLQTCRSRSLRNSKSCWWLGTSTWNRL